MTSRLSSACRNTQLHLRISSSQLKHSTTWQLMSASSKTTTSPVSLTFFSHPASYALFPYRWPSRNTLCLSFPLLHHQLQAARFRPEAAADLIQGRIHRGHLGLRRHVPGDILQTDEGWVLLPTQRCWRAPNSWGSRLPDLVPRLYRIRHIHVLSINQPDGKHHRLLGDRRALRHAWDGIQSAQERIRRCPIEDEGRIDHSHR